MEKEIELEQEAIVVYSGGGAVNSVNGYTGDVVLTTSDLENTSDYQTGTEVESAINTAIAGKQDTLTAGNNITISNNTISATDTTYSAGTNVSISPGNVISATDTTYTAGTGLSLNGTEFSADTTVLATQNDLSSKQNTLTAGSNITISGDTISATDTTYSDFTGTDGTAAGAAGLVPAPATTDAGKFLKADGTWDTAGGGGPTVVQTTGTSTTDVMSQDATTKLIYPSNSTDKIAIGASSTANYTVGIGASAEVRGDESVAIGYAAKTNIYATAIGRSANGSASAALAAGYGSEVTGNRGVALGNTTKVTHDNSVALGTNATTTRVGEVNVGTGTTGRGYNSTNYRVIGGVHDPVNAHDAATKGYVDNSLLGKANKISVVQTSASTIEINSNTFYKFGEVASLNITLASITDNTIYNEYMFEFVSGTTATTLTLPSSIKWLETPTIDANKIYQCSIVDNVGVLLGVSNV